jgi:hypothetical protein
MTISTGSRCPTCGRKHRRSNPANAKLWALLHEISDRVKPGGNSYSAEQWHTYFKSRYLGCDEVVLPNLKTLTIPRSSSALDVAEFGEYLDKIEAWAAERDVWLADREEA